MGDKKVENPWNPRVLDQTIKRYGVKYRTGDPVLPKQRMGYVPVGSTHPPSFERVYKAANRKEDLEKLQK